VDLGTCNELYKTGCKPPPSTVHLSRAKRLARGAALTAPLQSRDRPASHGVFTIQKLLDGAELWRREVGCLIVALREDSRAAPPGALVPPDRPPVRCAHVL